MDWANPATGGTAYLMACMLDRPGCAAALIQAGCDSHGRHLLPSQFCITSALYKQHTKNNPHSPLRGTCSITYTIIAVAGHVPMEVGT
jgi:hypothetical protein